MSHREGARPLRLHSQATSAPLQTRRSFPRRHAAHAHTFLPCLMRGRSPVGSPSLMGVRLGEKTQNESCPFPREGVRLDKDTLQRRARWLSSAIFWVLGTRPRTGSLLLTHQLEGPLGPHPRLALPSPLQGALFPQREVPVRWAQLLWTQGSAQRLVDE